jgi:hypothetical protein
VCSAHLHNSAFAATSKPPSETLVKNCTPDRRMCDNRSFIAYKLDANRHKSHWKTATIEQNDRPKMTFVCKWTLNCLSGEMTADGFFFRRKFSGSSSRYREIYCRGDNLYRLACSIWKLKFTLRRIAEMRNNWEIFTRNDVILTMLIRRTCEDLFEFFRSMAPFKRDIFLAERVGRDTRQEFGPRLGLRSNLSDLCPTPICLSYFVM